MISFVHDPDLAKPGSWRAWEGHYPIVVIRCPTCLLTGRLDHEIGPDGIVTPSVLCPGPGCSFHDQVKLEGWPPTL